VNSRRASSQLTSAFADKEVPRYYVFFLTGGGEHDQAWAEFKERNPDLEHNITTMYERAEEFELTARADAKAAFEEGCNGNYSVYGETESIGDCVVVECWVRDKYGDASLVARHWAGEELKYKAFSTEEE
jgi:hypothetical protein